jgi:predicted small secreted protein
MRNAESTSLKTAVILDICLLSNVDINSVKYLQIHKNHFRSHRRTHFSWLNLIPPIFYEAAFIFG